MAFLEISTILQAQTQVAATTQEFSFWKIMFHGNIFANVVMITVLLLGIFSFYLFLERFFFIKRMSSNTDPNLMRNIEDFLKRRKSRCSDRLLLPSGFSWSQNSGKGLSRIGRPVSDIVNAMEGQGQAEVANMEMNLNLLAAVPSIAPMLGLLGTVIGMILAFFNLSNSTGSFSPKTLSGYLYSIRTNSYRSCSGNPG